MRACIQEGHVGSARWGPGAQYEEAHIRLVTPYVVQTLRAAGVAVDVYGGDMPFGMTHDMFMSLHCDSGGTESVGWGLGWRDDTHPGSSTYARYVAEAYKRLHPPGNQYENITIGMRHYNGYSHFYAPTKCALIEMNFVSSARGRAWIEGNASAIGKAIASGMLAYAGLWEVEEMERWSNRQSWTRETLVEAHVFVGKNMDMTEDAWFAITPFDKDASITVTAIQDNATKTATYDIKQNKTQEVTASGFGLSGPMLIRVSSKVPVTVTVDRRGWA
jgi:hypothetical protein